MLNVLDIEIKNNEKFGFVGLVDSGKTTMLKKIYNMHSSQINYIEKLPFSFFKVKTVLRKNKNHEFVKKLGLNINKRISDLNYDETRKLLFLLSIFTNKNIIILDEPLLLVESHTKSIMLEIIKKIDKTILISFDNVQDAKLVCNRFAIIKDFNIVEIASNDDFEFIVVSIKALDIDKKLLPLKNMTIKHFNHDDIEFIYKGNVNELLKYLVDIDIISLQIRETNLEEIYKYCFKKLYF